MCATAIIAIGLAHLASDALLCVAASEAHNKIYQYYIYNETLDVWVKVIHSTIRYIPKGRFLSAVNDRTRRIRLAAMWMITRIVKAANMTMFPSMSVTC